MSTTDELDVLNKQNKTIEADESEEPCVLCFGKTGFLVKTPISLRRFYVEGVGQLCESCYYSLKSSQTKSND